MQRPSGFNILAVGMMIERLIERCAIAAAVLGGGLLLGSCSQFSAYIADHWPHWAGGMPSDVPPRPGAPGYDQFIAHGQSVQWRTDLPYGGVAHGIISAEVVLPAMRTQDDTIH